MSYPNFFLSLTVQTSTHFLYINLGLFHFLSSLFFDIRDLMRFQLLSWTMVQFIEKMISILLLINLRFIIYYDLNNRAIIKIAHMMKKKLWLMDNMAYQSFEKYRMQRYRASEIRRQIDDHPLTKFYTYIIVHFFRKRKISKDNPFIAQRLIHTAVCLFKRFHLVNQYNELPLVQNMIVCVYLSLKINQLPHDAIVQYANAWKSKNEAFLAEDCFHFKDPGYSDKELHFLRGIGFQLGRSPLIPAIQSLYHRIKQRINNTDLANELLDQILELIRRVYLDDKAIFLFEGPKIALAIAIQAIRIESVKQKLNLKQEQLLGQDISVVFERNRMEVEDIINYIGKLEKVEFKQLNSKAKELRQKIMKIKKNTYEVPEKKSPKLAPLSFEFIEH